MAATLQTERTRKPNLILRYLTILDWLPHYKRTGLNVGSIAGLTVWVLVALEAIANAGIAGLVAGWQPDCLQE